MECPCNNNTPFAPVWCVCVCVGVCFMPPPSPDGAAALLGYYISDDTVGGPIALYEQGYAFLKTLDPHHPVFNTIVGSGQAWQYTTPRKAFDVAQYEIYQASDLPQVLDTGFVPLNFPMRFTPQFICRYARTVAFVCLRLRAGSERRVLVVCDVCSVRCPSNVISQGYRTKDAGTREVRLEAYLVRATPNQCSEHGAPPCLSCTAHTHTHATPTTPRFPCRR